ncbi:hypothetical protein GCM10010466_29420 [Planomonospora alba]|uniref:CHAP domain-containing protein n=1 Tax=Planomonospora alba TaxID=161354 RepID=A0ABP6N5G3_9ACTN
MATASAVIKVARGELGYRESGNNDTKYNRWLGRIPGYAHGGYGYPWCAAFISWVADMAGAEDIIPRTASCLVGVKWFKDRGRFNRTPKVGSIVYYGANGGTHVEIVTKVNLLTITTIGGNTTGKGLTGAYYNGNAVAEKTVLRASSRIYGYGHPAYDEPGKHAKRPAKGKAPQFPGRIIRLRSPYMRGEDVRMWQEQMVKRGYKLAIDGVYGPKSADACTRFQRARKLLADGEVGPKTWAETWS